MAIRIQQADFNVGDEYQQLRADDRGAVVTFVGCVRSEDGIDALYLEHYPGMTEKSLQAIVDEANERWQLGNVTVIHRVGEIRAGEQIVFVGTSSGHRSEAFHAAEFIMDHLKTRAPFWKKEMRAGSEQWVEAKQSDSDKADRW